MTAENDETGGRLLKAVEAIAINPIEARSMVDKYLEQSRSDNPNASRQAHQEAVAKMVVKRYCRLAATSGGATALAGVIPGLGTAVTMLGGGLADAAFCMKLQVDMCMCLAAAFGWDLENEDARHLCFLIAAGGALEKAGVEATTRIASKAGVNMLRQYLKGATLQAMKELFKKLGIVFTRKALEKALPFGIGVVIGSGANYALTKYVGAEAIAWFVLDRDSREGSASI
ncbi:hypothetical protein BE04_26145 [Sorangium cellulosum]|uniref:EcsC family protein n=1 Tax=Sorangium cellulosum TaxID=56 RepID=A0A150P3B0_SORCE|nr:hypothetical protein BE04_26145 [Sorangium cellulosum]